MTGGLYDLTRNARMIYHVKVLSCNIESKNSGTRIRERAGIADWHTEQRSLQKTSKIVHSYIYFQLNIILDSLHSTELKEEEKDHPTL